MSSPVLNFSDGEISELGERGYLIRDTFLGEPLARRVHADAQTLVVKGALVPAGVGREQRTHAPQIRTDSTYWPEADDTCESLREAWQAFAALQQQLNAQAWLGLKRFELQLAHYGPGGRYQRHRDAFLGDDNRRVTAIVYLNPDWSSADGGHLRIYRDEPFDLEPRLDRLVIFLSERIEHEVLPNTAGRFALTAWYRSR